MYIIYVYNEEDKFWESKTHTRNFKEMNNIVSELNAAGKIVNVKYYEGL